MQADNCAKKGATFTSKFSVEPGVFCEGNPEQSATSKLSAEGSASLGVNQSQIKVAGIPSTSFSETPEILPIEFDL